MCHTDIYMYYIHTIPLPTKFIICKKKIKKIRKHCFCSLTPILVTLILWVRSQKWVQHYKRPSSLQISISFWGLRKPFKNYNMSCQPQMKYSKIDQKSQVPKISFVRLAGCRKKLPENLLTLHVQGLCFTKLLGKSITLTLRVPEVTMEPQRLCLGQSYRRWCSRAREKWKKKKKKEPSTKPETRNYVMSKWLKWKKWNK